EVGFTMGQVDALKEYLEQFPDIRLVIIDPASAYVGKIDDYKDAELRGMLGPMALLAAEKDVAIILVKHLTKGAQEKAVRRIGGSAGYVNAVRAAFVIGEDADTSNKVLWSLKFNCGKPVGSLAFQTKPLDELEVISFINQYIRSIDEEGQEELKDQLFS